MSLIIFFTTNIVFTTLVKILLFIMICAKNSFKSDDMEFKCLAWVAQEILNIFAVKWIIWSL